MRFFSLFIIILSLLNSCAPLQPPKPDPTKLASINIVDRNGFSETIHSSQRLTNYQQADFLQHQPYQKVMRVYQHDKCGSTKAIITSYYPNGQVKQYLEATDNRAYGKYKEWFSNGLKKLEANVIGGEADITPNAESSWIFDDVNQAWDEFGNLIAVIPYSKGKLYGTAKTFYQNGQLQRLTPYINDSLEGRVKIYRPSGELWSTTEYSEDLREGFSKVFWQDKTLAAQEHYHQDSLLTGSYYDLRGNLISEVVNGNGFRAIFAENGLEELQEYRDGQLEGMIKVFNEKEELIRTYHLKNGLKHGPETEFFAKTSSPKLSINWAQGSIQGLIKTWYSNGTPESSREMSSNKKNGFTTVWYPNGNLMLIEEYLEGSLVKGEYHRKGDSRPISKVIEGNGQATIFDGDGNIIRKISYSNGFPIEK
ncbi:MAG: toxin-antitoxin system YwqK family antitoxin [Chlamydiota bacterium]